MDIEFTLKNLQAAVKAVRQIHAKGPGGEDEVQDCLVASQDDRTTVKLESASNGLYCSVMIPADVQDPGAVVINRDVLAGFRFRGDRVKFQHDAGSTSLAFHAGEFRGKVQVSETLDDIEARRPLKLPELSIGIPTDVLKTAMKRLCFPTTKLDDGPLRMRIHVTKNTLTMSTNDSFRAAAHWVDYEGDATGTLVVPALFFANCCAVIDDDEIRLGFNERLIRVKGGGVDVFHPVLQGRAADVITAVKQYARQDPVMTCHFNAGSAYDAVDQVTSIIKALKYDARLDVQVRPNGVMKAGVKTESSQADCRFPAQDVEAPGVASFAFNARFMLEFLKLLPRNDQVQMIAWDKKVVLQTDNQVLIMPKLIPGRAKKAA